MQNIPTQELTYADKCRQDVERIRIACKSYHLKRVRYEDIVKVDKSIGKNSHMGWLTNKKH